MKSLFEKSGAFLTETNTVKIKEKQEIKREKTPKKIVPQPKEEKVEAPKINYDHDFKKVFIYFYNYRQTNSTRRFYFILKIVKSTQTFQFLQELLSLKKCSLWIMQKKP